MWNNKDISIEYLLGRPEIKLDQEIIINSIKDKSVLISGGGGSIGSEVCRQVARLKPKKLIIIDNSEFNLYSIHQEISEKYPHILLEICLSDICDKREIYENFEAHKPQLVFHTAAYKHVPLLQTQIKPAIKNNIIGSKILIQAAINFKCERFVLISSDKAVNPTSIMGLTKRAAEIICQSLCPVSNFIYTVIRFGNILGSSGSVVPLFQKQIQMGGPITVTDPEVSRYFMTNAEAAQLILQATAISEGNEVFVLDMGVPIKIKDLAEKMVNNYTSQTGKKIEIVYTGLRPGEKLHEELFYKDEQLFKTHSNKIFKANEKSKKSAFNIKDLTYMLDKYWEKNDLRNCIKILLKLVPEANIPSYENSYSHKFKVAKV